LSLEILWEWEAIEQCKSRKTLNCSQIVKRIELWYT
jgi:hypothetical protein